jgi:hypothetical protein
MFCLLRFAVLLTHDSAAMLSPTHDSDLADQWGDGLLDSASVKMELDNSLVKPEDSQAAAFRSAFEARVSPITAELGVDDGGMNVEEAAAVLSQEAEDASQQEQDEADDWRQAGQLWLLLHADNCVGVCHIPQCSTMRQVNEHCKTCATTHCQLSCQQAKSLLLVFEQYKQGQRSKCGICAKLSEVAKLWEAQGAGSVGAL